MISLLRIAPRSPSGDATCPCTAHDNLPQPWFSRYLDRIVASPAKIRYSMTSFMTT